MNFEDPFPPAPWPPAPSPGSTPWAPSPGDTLPGDFPPHWAPGCRGQPPLSSHLKKRKNNAGKGIFLFFTRKEGHRKKEIESDIVFIHLYYKH